MREASAKDVLEHVDWGALSDRGAWILRNVAVPATFGLTREEIAEQLGRRPSFVKRALRELRAELEGQLESGGRA